MLFFYQHTELPLNNKYIQNTNKVHRQVGDGVSLFNNFIPIIIKAILCILIQLPSIWFITYVQIRDGLDIKDWCNFAEDDVTFDHVATKYFALLISLFLSMKFVGIYNESSYMGMYVCFPFTIPEKLINVGWLFLGLYINIFTAIFAVWASFCVIFFSESVFDLILNSVAMLFILEIDDYMVDDEDYKKIAVKIQEIYYDDNGEFKEDENGELFKAAELSGCQLCCRAVGLKLVIGLFYVTIVAGVILPFYVGVCF